MIIKGKSRAGPSQLAHHLGRADTNERVEILQLDSAGTTAEAFRDWQTYTLATKGKLGLYHANIDPDTKYEMTPQQWARAVEILEEELGLQGQPRAVVMHEKNGREHIHVVWARADMDTMTLRSDSQNYQAHERASLRMEQEFGHEHVPGKHAKRDRDVQPEFPSADARHDEWQQAERGGIDHRERKAQVTTLYEASDTGPAFKAALEDAGYVLARGDRRDFVILDTDAKAHSLGRQLPGVKAAELRAFMVDIDSESLPSVKEARAAIREATRAEPTPEQPRLPEHVAPQQEPPASDRDPAPTWEDAHIESLRRAIMEQHSVELKEQELRHAREVETLQQEQEAKATKAIEDFAKEQAQRAVAERPQEPGGFERMWRNIREAVDEEARRQRLADEARRAADLEDRRNDEIRIMVSGLNAAQRQEIDTLVDRQGKERADLLREQASDLKRRIEDDERARQLAREYEKRQQEALAREREGPERDPRAR
ncbi:Relaxase/Mobilisation nuclease domain-containing protein [Sphingomonas laterariae]|uniref:Relaxase/Mobilisation nuclease domain-containing protein n=1 Tax=Edaphosphingomonas laterariae TaxID=861865 RepID=A0A239DIJ3_9SPHN|nr:Relaxase/Mobilisation nuclease domain-containing protein [Sphingomonas laterariae]